MRLSGAGLGPLIWQFGLRLNGETLGSRSHCGDRNFLPLTFQGGYD